MDEECSDVSELDSHIGSKNKSITFLLIHMIGCEPCERVLPEWLKIENIIRDNIGEDVLKKNGVVIADIDNGSAIQLKNVEKVFSFPTILFFKNGKKETYENSEVYKKKKDEEKYKIDDFMEWIFSKCPNIQDGGNKKINRKTKKNRKGGKWTRKYKHSINCKRPKGFSQKQYCKYGRNK
jgi:hypothetical protein